MDGGEEISLELLQEVSCEAEGDCSPKATGLTCVKGSCVCPFYQALNVSSCQCQEAAKCEHECPAQHNGRRCENEFCSCFPSLDFSLLVLCSTRRSVRPCLSLRHRRPHCSLRAGKSGLPGSLRCSRNGLAQELRL